MTLFLAKLKEYGKWLVAALLTILTGAFLFERAKNKTNEALVNNDAALKQIDKMNAQVAVNNEQLQVEEQKREEIAKKEQDAEHAPTDPADFFNSRK